MNPQIINRWIYKSIVNPFWPYNKRRYCQRMDSKKTIWGIHINMWLCVWPEKLIVRPHTLTPTQMTETRFQKRYMLLSRSLSPRNHFVPRLFIIYVNNKNNNIIQTRQMHVQLSHSAYIISAEHVFIYRRCFMTRHKISTHTYII